MLKLQQQNRTSAVIPLVALTGALIGSAAALLLAPKKGSDFRNGIKDVARKLKPGFNNATAENNKGNAAHEQSYGYHKATMHAVGNDGPKEEHPSKASAMVNHLKQSKSQNNGHPEIL